VFDAFADLAMQDIVVDVVASNPAPAQPAAAAAAAPAAAAAAAARTASPALVAQAPAAHPQPVRVMLFSSLRCLEFRDKSSGPIVCITFLFLSHTE
jgi:hypothetical protein